ncbi:MAG: hypothetical protein M1835_002204 [Candelina submexicana]|nr:MAG: hypothetical protein M1835_002204 [Candelina submexicana]
MASPLDYSKLRAQTLGSALDEEAVTVNTRALIDKVLARYSGEWTVLRELLQNAADASASSVTIKFETLPSPNVPVPNSNEPSSTLKHIILHHTLRRLVVINDGHAFGANDWSRLKRIAEGNPDETKIGAFGVGFYSVFADCEEPFVSSGKEAMAFYWKGNSLFTRRLQLSEEHTRPETSFVLDYREKTSPVPTLLSLCQFLAISLTFVGLEQIELWIDDWLILKLNKKGASSDSVTLPKDVETKTTDGMMRVLGVERQRVQIDADSINIIGWRPPADTFGGNTTTNTPSLRSFFSRLAAGSSSDGGITKAAKEEKAVQQALSGDLAGRSRASVFLHITTANIRTTVSTSFSHELQRATKKPPPAITKLAILTSSYDEFLASRTSSGDLPVHQGVNIFSTVLPTKSGNIFIGFPTAQTTGLLAHISAPSVIPTVERESIDLVNQRVKTWNIEMLRIAGIVSRIAWSSEMQSIKAKLIRDHGEVASVVPEAIHAFKQFTFYDSTPSSRVRQIVEEAFWTCNKMASIDIVSTQGVLPSHDVRIATENLSFVNGIPLLPEEVSKGAQGFVSKLREYGLLTEITVSDIRKELGSKAISEIQLLDFLRWAGRKTVGGDINVTMIRSLLDVAVATLSDAGEGSGQVIVVGSIKYFINAARIPADLPAPSTAMPFRFTKNLPGSELEALGWEELQIVPWLRWLVENTGGQRDLTLENDLTGSPPFAAKVLPVLSKQWDSLSQSSKATIVELLASRTVIPTKRGMKRPAEAYFASVKLFDDLPVITSLHSVKDKFLVALGVRKTIELGVVFDRLMEAPSGNLSSGTKWSHVDLIRYLASVRDDIPTDDIKRLKSTAICPAEVEQTVNKASSKRYKVGELFEPKDSLRSLNLPILQWPGVYRSGSSEGKFLAVLGLRATPSVPELVEIISKASAVNNLALRDHAMTYFISNHHFNNYAKFDTSTIRIPFLYLHGGSAGQLVTSTECFTNERAAVLGFPILARDLQPHALKFGVAPDPPMIECVIRLIGAPPKTRREAREVFSYFAGRLNDVGADSVERLSGAGIVPIFRKTQTTNAILSGKSEVARYVAPRMCFLGDSQTYGDIFDFVDFGQEANTFLLKCGSKHEPSKVELAQMIVREPARLLSVFQSPEKYLGLLRNLADSLRALKSNKTLYREMKAAPFLLACRVVSTKPSKTQSRTPHHEGMDESDDDDGTGINEWVLASASQVVIVDDFISYSLFKDKLLAAPQEEVLEDFYFNLGAPLLSTIVQEQPRIGSIVEDQRGAVKLQKLVNERARLFLHDYPSDAVQHDARWLEKNLAVQTVRSISLRRTLSGYNLSHTETRTAAVMQDQRKATHTLWVSAGELDYFQVSQALLSLLLARPKPHSAMMLETLLSTDLLKLRSRGYNVERILRQKAAEARIAEDQRQKQLEEERKQIQEAEHAWKQSEQQRREDGHGKQAGLPIPGAFGDSPEQKDSEKQNKDVAESLQGKRPRGLFSALTKRLFDENDRSSQHLQNFLGNNARAPAPEVSQQQFLPPPPYTPRDSKQPKPTGQQTEAVTAPHQLHQNLLSAINASRPHDSANVFSRPQTNTIKETASYCDERPANDLNFLANLSSGIMIFLAKEVTSRDTFLETHSSGLNTFSGILVECANVFGIPRKSLQIYYDEAGGTIAFNKGGSYFCNYRFFNQLHLGGMERGEKKAEAMVYWWVVLCHELAHNIVPDHSSDHSYYTESFVMQYFGKMMVKVSQLLQDTNGVRQIAPGLIDVD